MSQAAHWTEPAPALPIPAPEARPWKRGFAWLLFLGPFFFASYGLANWLAAQHAHVATIVFDWERRIPFLPWTIAPYWLIDALYAASLLLCPTRRALDTHARRLLAAQVIAIACFVAFPLRFSFERSEAAGAFGWMFDALAGFDLPFNQAPSLHIALLVILWMFYARAVPSRWRGLVHAIAILIGVSTLTTWQHHFVDVPTGLWLGWLCVWHFPDDARSPLSAARLTRDRGRRRLASIYAIAALSLGYTAAGAGGAWAWLLWGAGSLALVALVYGFLDESAFQKRSDGSLSVASRWLFAPYLAGAWLNSRWWTRSHPAPDCIAPGVFVGRVPTRAEQARSGVETIVDVAAELPCARGDATYRSVPMLDLVAPRGDQIERACAAIEEAVRRGPVLVCCALGVSRSALAAAAWLVRSGAARTCEDALAQVRQARPGVVLRPAHADALAEWHRRYGERA